MAVETDLTFTELSAGYDLSCALTGQGAAYCWGVFHTDSSRTREAWSPHTSPIRLSGGLTFTSVSARGWLRACGVTTSHSIVCWGQLVTGAGTEWTLYPRVIPGGLSFATVSVGYRHACGLTTTGTAHCWGDNASGALGDGTLSWSDNPVKVVGQR